VQESSTTAVGGVKGQRTLALRGSRSCEESPYFAFIDDIERSEIARSVFAHFS
jgi:hypothetical protein